MARGAGMQIRCNSCGHMAETPPDRDRKPFNCDRCNGTVSRTPWTRSSRGGCRTRRGAWGTVEKAQELLRAGTSRRKAALYRRAHGPSLCPVDTAPAGRRGLQPGITSNGRGRTERITGETGKTDAWETPSAKGRLMWCSILRPCREALMLYHGVRSVPALRFEC